MEERLARTIREIETLDRLSTFEDNAKQRNALTDELKAAIRMRAIDIGRELVEKRTGLDLSYLTPAQEKIVQAVSEYVSVKKREGKNANRTLKQLKDHGLTDAAEAAVSRTRPTQGFQTLADEDLLNLSYEQIVVDHPDEFSPRAVWFARKTLGLPNDSDKPPAKATTPTQMRTERLLGWLRQKSEANGGSIPIYTNADAAAYLDMPDMHQYGRVFGNIQSRIDFACYLAGMPPLGLVAQAPFDRAWNQDDRDWAFPIADMQAVARARIWSAKDFDRILNETERLPGQAHISWIKEFEDNEANVKAWAFGLGKLNPAENLTADTGESGTRRNPAWSREELILALDLYLRSREMPFSKDSDEVAELSAFLGKMGRILGFTEAETYRNTNGVYMKMMNFRRFDPQYTSEGKVGLSRGNKLEEMVWNEFAEDPVRLASTIISIRQKVDSDDIDQKPEEFYWVFVCNPKKWNIDRFLEQRIEHDTWGIRPSDRDRFAPGQLGIVRVGVDQRTAAERQGKPPLEAGIYALCEVESEAFNGTGASSEFWSPGKAREPGWPTVKIRYLRAYPTTPLTIERLRAEKPDLSPLLLNGFQAASFPISANDFHAVMSLLQVDLEDLPSPSEQSEILSDKLDAMEAKYLHASPEVKERQSKAVERGPIGDLVKKVRGYKCQLCEALGHNPIGFLKTNGVPYVEAHHVMPVAKREIGSLASSNVMTLCANHHRQIHYGGVRVKICAETFELLIDGAPVLIPRLGIPNRTTSEQV